MMKKLVFLCGVFFIVNGNAATWYKFISEKGNFSVLFPGKPIETTQNLNTNVGAVVAHIFNVIDSTSNKNYFISYCDFPDSYSISNTDFLFDNSIQGIVNNTKGILKNKKGVTIDGVFGQEIEVELPSGRTLVQKIFLVKKRLFQLGVDMNKGMVLDYLQFFDSFKLLQGKENGNSKLNNDDFKIEFSISNLLINGQSITINQPIRLSNKTEIIPISVDERTGIELMYVDNRKSNFKSLLLFNLYSKKNSKEKWRKIIDGEITVVPTNMKNSFKIEINNDKVSYDYQLNFLK